MTDESGISKQQISVTKNDRAKNLSFFVVMPDCPNTVCGRHM